MSDLEKVDGVATLRIGELEYEVDVYSVEAEQKKPVLLDTTRLRDFEPHYIEALDTTPQRVTINGFFRRCTNKADRRSPKDRIIPKIKKVIFNPPATIVLWGDGTKTVVKANDRCGHTVTATSYSDNGETKTEEIEIGELYDPEKGLAMCIAKKALGNKGNYYNEFKRWLEDNGEND